MTEHTRGLHYHDHGHDAKPCKYDDDGCSDEAIPTASYPARRDKRSVQYRSARHNETEGAGQVGCPGYSVVTAPFSHGGVCALVRIHPRMGIQVRGIHGPGYCSRAQYTNSYYSQELRYTLRISPRPSTRSIGVRGGWFSAYGNHGAVRSVSLRDCGRGGRPLWLGAGPHQPLPAEQSG